jgi:hypothetical protein
VEFGVRQGSILGPILYLVLVADMSDCLDIGEEDNSGYADDTAIWAVGRDLALVKALLETRGGCLCALCHRERPHPQCSQDTAHGWWQYQEQGHRLL